MSDRDTVARVVVAGGGIGGLTLGVALQRCKIPVTVLERSPQLEEIGAYIGIQSNAMNAFGKIGLAGELRCRGTVIDRFQLRSWRGTHLARVDLETIAASVGAPALIVHRADVQRVLRAAYTQQLCLGREVVDFSCARTRSSRH